MYARMCMQWCMYACMHARMYACMCTCNVHIITLTHTRVQAHRLHVLGQDNITLPHGTACATALRRPKLLRNLKLAANPPEDAPRLGDARIRLALVGELLQRPGDDGGASGGWTATRTGGHARAGTRSVTDCRARACRRTGVCGRVCSCRSNTTDLMTQQGRCLPCQPPPLPAAGAPRHGATVPRGGPPGARLAAVGTRRRRRRPPQSRGTKAARRLSREMETPGKQRGCCCRRRRAGARAAAAAH